MMERDQNLEGQPLANFDLAEPHFNDERTIQTARPVVPLNPFLRILTKRRVAFAGAFMLAALLGAGSALAIIHLRRPLDPNLSQAAKTEETEPEATTEAQPSEDLDQSSTEAMAVESDPNKSAETLPAQRRVKPHRQSRPVQETSESMPKVTISVKTNDSQPQARLIDEWQERRQRRVAHPERPNNHHQRDLFRIREIFEGPRRRP
jgi:hypothetical protein